MNVRKEIELYAKGEADEYVDEDPEAKYESLHVVELAFPCWLNRNNK